MAHHPQDRGNGSQDLTGIDTIAAVATARGVGGVGVVRISGPAVPELAGALIGKLPPARQACLASFLDGQGLAIDQGIALYFPAPKSFTGEHVLELQGHGGPLVLDLLLRRVLELGPRLARPGEFSERAFLNGKLDLAQAEAVADLIESATEAAARLAMRTLQGEFSRRVRALQEQLIEARAWTEAALDFSDQDLDPLEDGHISILLDRLGAALDQVRRGARQGQLLRDGLTLVIAGLPNAGKSSLLNALAGHERAIVTEIPGTTRDLLRERIQLDGLPLHIVDTAGLRDVGDRVEQEGVRRARAQLTQADRILWVTDANQPADHDAAERARLPKEIPLTLIRNKIDQAGMAPESRQTPEGWQVALSARTSAGLDLLREHHKASAGYQGPAEGEIMARRRHLDALQRAASHLQTGRALWQAGALLELLAEELRLAQQDLAEITGDYLPDDLLGEIFGRFCIGK